uniref:PXA domain-containing protein n=1 Tax=Parastrongyloides trichosuri TaxID=131310 RepID=A0A0N4ZB29_PARTI
MEKELKNEVDENVEIIDNNDSNKEVENIDDKKSEEDKQKTHVLLEIKDLEFNEVFCEKTFTDLIEILESKEVKCYTDFQLNINTIIKHFADDNHKGHDLKKTLLSIEPHIAKILSFPIPFSLRNDVLKIYCMGVLNVEEKNSYHICSLKFVETLIHNAILKDFGVYGLPEEKINKADEFEYRIMAKRVYSQFGKHIPLPGLPRTISYLNRFLPVFQDNISDLVRKLLYLINDKNPNKEQFYDDIEKITELSGLLIPVLLDFSQSKDFKKLITQSNLYKILENVTKMTSIIFINEKNKPLISKDTFPPVVRACFVTLAVFECTVCTKADTIQEITQFAYQVDSWGKIIGFLAELEDVEEVLLTSILSAPQGSLKERKKKKKKNDEQEIVSEQSDNHEIQNSLASYLTKYRFLREYYIRRMGENIIKHANIITK